MIQLDRAFLPPFSQFRMAAVLSQKSSFSATTARRGRSWSHLLDNNLTISDSTGYSINYCFYAQAWSAPLPAGPLSWGPGWWLWPMDRKTRAQPNSLPLPFSAQNNKAAVMQAAIMTSTAAALASPLAAQAAVTPSLKNFLLSLVAGATVLAVIAGGITVISNFDPVNRGWMQLEIMDAWARWIGVQWP